MIRIHIFCRELLSLEPYSPGWWNLVYTYVSEAYAARLGGSSPPPGTIKRKVLTYNRQDFSLYRTEANEERVLLQVPYSINQTHSVQKSQVGFNRLVLSFLKAFQVAWPDVKR